MSDVTSSTIHMTDQGIATWTAIRLATSSNESLSKVGRNLGLETCIQNSLTNVEGISPYMMATAVEAIVGAVYLDSEKDLKVVERSLLKIGILGDAE